MAARPPCRLTVILARQAPVGVIFRRGPSAWTQISRWNTSDDSIQPGQWFRGKIDPDKSDVSPAGDRMIYFARSAKQRSVAAGYGWTWTAISRPPYLTALALWPLGDTWFGGGLFLDQDTVQLNHPSCNALPHPDHPPRRLKVRIEPMIFWERSVRSERMIRDGWILRRKIKVGGLGGLYPEEWEKPTPKAGRTLRLLDDSPLLRKEPFQYVVEYGAKRLELPFQAEWADWDQQGRLVFANQGRLWWVEFPRRGLAAVHEIAGLNAARPDPQPSPAWASRWP